MSNPIPPTVRAECDTPAAFAAALTAGLDEDALNRTLDRFPWGYGLHPRLAFDAAGDAARPLVAQACARGGAVILSCGRHAQPAAGFAAIVGPARALVAARLRERRRAGTCPRFPRCRQRRPWHWPDDPTNAADWPALQRAYGLAPAAAAGAPATPTPTAEAFRVTFVGVLTRKPRTQEFPSYPEAAGYAASLNRRYLAQEPTIERVPAAGTPAARA